MNVGKVDIKGGYHGNLPWVTSHEKELQGRLYVLEERRTLWVVAVGPTLQTKNLQALGTTFQARQNGQETGVGRIEGQ